MMTFLDHLKELRRRIFISCISIIVCTGIGLYIYPQAISFLLAPFKTIVQSELDNTLFISSLFEGFLTKFKVAILLGVGLSLPVHLYNLIRFIFPGLSKKERWVISIALLTSTLLIAGSFYLSYFKIIPLSISFLMTVGFIPTDVGILLNFNQNIFYIVQFIVVSMILFQFPILLELLLAMNLVSRKRLLKASRFIIIGILVLSALVTPPDFISQVSISVPLICLFFLTIGIAKIFNWGNT